MEQFFKTLMGRKFFEGQVPAIVNALNDIAKELKRANDLKEKESKQPEMSKDEITEIMSDPSKFLSKK